MEYSQFVDRWAIKGNEAADALAIWARQLLPPEVTQAHQRLKLASQVRYKACQALHRLLVEIGNKVTSEKEELKAKEESAWDAMQSQQPQVVEKVSFAQLPVDLIEPAEHALGEGFQTIYTWLLTLTRETGATPMWLSSYQLYAHFQLHTNHLGFFYNRKSKQFEPLNSGHKKNYNFIRAAGWFCAMIKSFAKTVSEECTVQPRMPFGSLFRSWQRCILLPASPATIEGVHSKFTSRGTTAVKSVHAAMSQYTDFCMGTTS